MSVFRQYICHRNRASVAGWGHVTFRQGKNVCMVENNSSRTRSRRHFRTLSMTEREQIRQLVSTVQNEGWTEKRALRDASLDAIGFGKLDNNNNLAEVDEKISGRVWHWSAKLDYRKQVSTLMVDIRGWCNEKLESEKTFNETVNEKVYRQCKFRGTRSEISDGIIKCSIFSHLFRNKRSFIYKKIRISFKYRFIDHYYHVWNQTVKSSDFAYILISWKINLMPTMFVLWCQHIHEYNW